MSMGLFFTIFASVACKGTKNIDSGDEFEEDTNNSTKISNSPPVIDSISLQPVSVYTNDTITATAMVSDVDTDQDISLRYAWYVIDAQSSETQMVQNGEENTLSGVLHFDKNDIVFVEVTAFDGIEDGFSLTSSQLNILNHPPSIPQISVQPNPARQGMDDLTCTGISTDIDNDEIFYSFFWRDPQGMIQQQNVETTEIEDVFEGTQTTEGTWTCEVFASDGTDQGQSIQQDVIVESIEACRSLEFDGIDDLVEVEDHSLFTLGYQNFTIEAIVYPYANCGNGYDNQCTYLSHSEGEGDVKKWSLNWSEQGFLDHRGHYMYIGGGQDRWLIQYQQSDFEERWNHVAYVRNGDILYLYINGQEVYHEDYESMVPNPSASLWIGGGDGNRWFFGKIFAIHISSVARYTQNFVPFQSFVADSDSIALWNVAESYGAVLSDVSGNDLHGTIHDATWVFSCPTEDLDGDGSTASVDCDDQNSNLQTHDFDEDGYSSCDGDCNGNDASIHPFAGDIYGDGIDSDCDGTDVCAGAMFDGTYFVACYEPKTWQDASESCQNRGYDGLATLLSEQENNFVHTIFPIHSQDNAGLYWIGLHDSSTEGVFGWSSGLVGSYFNWGEAEPSDGGGNEDCAHLYSNVFTQHLFWNDHPCTNNQSYVCEKR